MNIVVALVVVLVVWYVLSSLREEFDDESYAYQNNVQPFYLSRQAVNLWTGPAKKICQARVAAECASLPYEQRIGCVQQALIKCQQANAKTISQQCAASLPSTICKRNCKLGKKCCANCVNVVKAMGVCSTPDINL